MKKNWFPAVLAAFTIVLAGVGPVRADEDVTLEALKKQMRQMQEQMQSLQHKIEKLEARKQAAPPAAAPSSAPAEGVSKQEWKQLNEKVDRVAEAQRKVLPSEFNPAIGVVGETIFSYRSKDSKDTGSERPGGFDVFQRSLELNLSASVDPFARGYVVINAEADPITGEADASVEEASILTTSLPWNLTVQGGRFFGEFGRLAYIHDHELPFVNRPLVLDEFVGGESKTDGLQINWLLPLKHYVSLTVGAGDQFGDTPNGVGGFRNFNGLNFWGRLSSSFDLAPDWQAETGLSALLNPKTDGRGDPFELADGSTLTERKRRMAGLDFSLRYLPLRNNQFRSLTWGTEILYSDNEYRVAPDGNPDVPGSDRSVDAWGGYSYLAYRYDRSWTFGFLFDYAENPQDDSEKTYAYSPYVTLALSHWNQLRLQYTHTARDGSSDLKDDDAVYLQWTWIIGSHSHGWQQR